MKSFLFTALILTSGAVFAEDCNVINDYNKMVDCERNELNSTDVKLNKLYQSQIKKLGSDKKALSYYKQNQRDWLKYARNYCDAGSLASNDDFLGSFYPTAFAMCFNNVSQSRIKELEGFDCEEGDMSSTCIMSKN